ncbi:hypothetical protein RHMOL_Rhmol11G0235500 [Rhododendron molle]|uniref:Uncharacterized protein n=1 Tax=Rhododendron molle TaxID=49168 RepID=A0ACC0LWP2_RHOML|nr:hypothetical protein RHMOL_Rhmol11G0235500 [Rhododendron molle]
MFFSSLGQRFLLSLSLNTIKRLRISTSQLTNAVFRKLRAKSENKGFLFPNALWLQKKKKRRRKASAVYRNLWCIDCSAVRRSQLRQVILNSTCYVAYDACCGRPWLGFGRGGAPSIVIVIIFVEKLVRSGGILLVTNFGKGNQYNVRKSTSVSVLPRPSFLHPRRRGEHHGSDSYDLESLLKPSTMKHAALYLSSLQWLEYTLHGFRWHAAFRLC